MKKIVYLLVFMTMSCSSAYKWENLSIYKHERVGEIAPVYLIIKGGALKQCDLVYPDLSYGVVGNYIAKQDTLVFYAKYNYYSSSISASDSIPYIFILKNNYLIHVMNDSIWGKHEELYKRMK